MVLRGIDCPASDRRGKCVLLPGTRVNACGDQCKLNPEPGVDKPASRKAQGIVLDFNEFRNNLSI